MSYKYGLNGNDIDWDYMENKYIHCQDCTQHRANLLSAYDLEKHDMEDCPIQNCELCAMEKSLESFGCEGHTIVYGSDEDNWYIFHDTNGNFVAMSGNVPAIVFVTDYLMEYLESEREELDDDRIQEIEDELYARGAL